MREMTDDEPRPATPAPHLGLLRISGPDAVSFLQGQVTHDLTLLEDGRTMLAACNTPQGRVIALLRLCRGVDAVYAAMPGELLSLVRERLRRYVLRAKVQIEIDARGLRPGDAARPPRESPGLTFDWAPGRALVATDDPSTKPPTSKDAAETSGALLKPATVCVDWHRWQLADIACGLPQVVATTSGHFVAQMLNLDLLDGISFTKGCYTGQEIIARTHHLGRIKRRMLRYAVQDGVPPLPMAALHHNGAKVAEVLVSAARDGGSELLAVTSLDARDRPLALDDGRIAEPLPLPYTV